MLRSILGAIVVAVVCVLTPDALQADVKLVDRGKPAVSIVLSTRSAPPERFAAEELQRYIERISGAHLPITSDVPKLGATLRVGASPKAPVDPWDDSFRVAVRGQSITLDGQNPRATLFAAYALLEQLGCRWFAPNFSFYPGGQAELLPRSATLTLKEGVTSESPSMRYRAKYVEEGHTHTAENLPALVDWMAKTRQNVFCCPTDYGGSGRIRWDNFRERLVPEIKKRGLLIEVGGHGYQNFLPADRYFAEHPEWFGVDERGKRTRAKARVFATSNPAALAEFTRNVLAYLRAHPEIDIFDLWPPDGAKWSEAAECKALGEPTVRHALVVNHIARAVAKEFPGLTIEFIAYASYLTPPVGVEFAPNTLVGFCPISQSFTTRINDPGNAANKRYWDALQEWQARPDVKGRVYVYSYYRKYAWRSRPVITPKLITEDAQIYRKAGVIGLSSYSEPGDWLTYELQHLVLAHASWNAGLDSAEFLRTYCTKRFGAAARPMERFFTLVETTIPQAANIPGTPAPAAETMVKYLQSLAKAKAAIVEAERLLGNDHDTLSLVHRLGTALEYARLDIARRGDPAKDAAAAADLSALLKTNVNNGLFVEPDRILARFLPTAP